MWGEKRRGSIACVQSPPPLRKDRERGWGEGAAVLRLSEARCGEREWELTRAFSCHSNCRGCYQSITFLGGRARSLFGEPVYASNVLYLMAPRLVFHPFQPTLGNITTLRHSHLPHTKNAHKRVMQRRPSVRSDCVLLKLWSCMQTQQTQNSFPCPKSYRDFRETGPWLDLIFMYSVITYWPGSRLFWRPRWRRCRRRRCL